ncbi:MAG: hypothetical protein Q9201_001752 [Fulgogasparrea decipioides]
MEFKRLIQPEKNRNRNSHDTTATTGPFPIEKNYLQDIECRAKSEGEPNSDTGFSQSNAIMTPTHVSEAQHSELPRIPPVTKTAKEIREARKQEMKDSWWKSNPISKKQSKKPAKDASKSGPLSPASQLAHDFLEKDAADTLRECIDDVYRKGLEKWRAKLDGGRFGRCGGQ